MKLTKAQCETAKSNNIPLSRVRQRIHQGWDVDKATTTPVRHKKKTHGGMKVCGTFITSEQLRIAEENGLNRDMIRHRVYRGMRVLDAITEEKYTPEIKKHYTDADRKTAEKNGLTMDLVYQRVKRGWGKKKALSTPVRSKARRKNDGQAEEQEALARIARTKYLNRTEFRDNPMPYMKSDLKKLSALGISVDEVEEIKA